MRKFVLGTTALTAAALLAAPAMAEDEMAEPTASISMSGYALGIAGIASDDTNADGAPIRGEEVFYVMEFDVTGSITLDNGVTVTGYGQVGSHNADAITETHLTLSGTFGSLRIGETESAAFGATVAAPGGGVGMGVNYPWYSPAAPSVNTYSGLVEDALKVVYTSPNFNGLSIGLSYAPDGGTKNGASVRTTNDVDAKGKGQMSEHAAIGASYSMGFMDGGTVSVGLGYEMATDEGGGPDMEAMKAGASVSVDQVSFGGGVYEATPEGGDGVMQYDVGASYTEGPTTVGLQYAGNDAGDTGMAALNLTYTMGPGVKVGGQVASGTAAGADDVTQFLLGTQINF